MRRRQPHRRSIPRLWLMTDERQGEALFVALERLPRGVGLVFRHYGLPPPARRTLFERIRRVARRRGLVLVAAAPAGLTLRRGDGVHNCPRPARHAGLLTASAHNVREMRAAARQGADLIFLSPVFPTRSHPGAHSLGPLRFAMLAHRTRLPVIALGGMNAARGRRLRTLGAYGWAGIDAWSGEVR